MYASHPRPQIETVKSLLDRHGIQYQMYGLDRNWRGFGAKLRSAYRAALELEWHDYILLLDPPDCVPLGGPEAILERFEAFRHPWVCAAEPNIWPAGSFRTEDYPETQSPWKYLNSGSYLVERRYLKECFQRWAPEGPDSIPTRVDDQQWLADKFIHEPGCIKLDTGCQLFQCLIGGWWAFEVEPGRLYNKVTGTEPLILHHNGGGDIFEERVRVLWQS